MMAFVLVPHGIVALLLLAASIVDWRRREIPEWVNIGILMLAPVHWWASGMTLWPGLAIQLGIALVAFAVFTGVWMLRQMGGGDVKLITALALFLAPLDFAQMLYVMALSGAVLTVAMYLRWRALGRPGDFENPYGIAIAFGGLWVIAERYLNHLA